MGDATGQLPFMADPAMTRRRSRRGGPSTSHAAAESIAGVAGAQARNVLEILAAAGGYGRTDEDIYTASATGSASGLRTRRRELCDLGHVEDTGETRPTITGRASKVWRITAKGMEVLR